MKVLEEKISIVTIKLNKYEAQRLKSLCQDTAWTDEVEAFRRNLWIALNDAGVDSV